MGQVSIRIDTVFLPSLFQPLILSSSHPPPTSLHPPHKETKMSSQAANQVQPTFQPPSKPPSPPTPPPQRHRPKRPLSRPPQSTASTFSLATSPIQQRFMELNHRPYLNVTICLAYELGLFAAIPSPNPNPINITVSDLAMGKKGRTHSF